MFIANISKSELHILCEVERLIKRRNSDYCPTYEYNGAILLAPDKLSSLFSDDKDVRFSQRLDLQRLLDRGFLVVGLDYDLKTPVAWLTPKGGRYLQSHHRRQELRKSLERVPGSLWKNKAPMWGILIALLTVTALITEIVRNLHTG